MNEKRKLSKQEKDFFIKRAIDWDDYLRSLSKEESQRIFSDQDEYTDRYREFCDKYNAEV